MEFDDDWEPSLEDVQALALERSVRPAETFVDTTERLFEEAAPSAAQTIIRLATNERANERVRLDAAKYVVERALGKIGDTKTTTTGNPWDSVFAVMTKEVEEHANSVQE